MTHKNSWGKRLTAAAGVTALVAAGFAGTAFAAPTTPSGAGAVDGTQARSLTIHKHKVAHDANLTTRDKGKELETAPSDPIAGVQFTLQRLCYDGAPLDLTKAADWTRVQDIVGESGTELTADAVETKMKADTKYTWCDLEDANGNEQADDNVITTNAQGVAQLTGKAATASLFKVEETYVPASANIGTTVDPFIVTLPLLDKTTSTWSWNYNVHVYPKNREIDPNDKPKKTLDADPGLTVLADDTTELSWTITFKVPPVGEGNDLTSLAIEEVIPEGLKLTEITSVKNGDTDLGYTTDPASLDGLAFGKDVTITLATADGVVKDVAVGDTITVKVKTAISSDGAKKTRNSFKFYVNDTQKQNPGGPDTGCTETDPADCDTTDDGVDVVNTGAIKITKVDSSNAALKGAVFELYKADDIENGKPKDGASPIAATVQNGASTTPVTEFPVGDGENGTTLGVAQVTVTLGMNVDSKEFCFVEKKAPSGYKLNTTPQCATVTKDRVVEAGTDGKLVNVPDDRILPNLPLTGANGLMVLTLGGAALVLLGVGSVMVVRRRQAED